MKDLQVTLHLKADSPEELSMMTVQAQARWGLVLNFFDFSQDKSGKWICWFKVPHRVWIEKVANGKA